jgi:demethylmenaquinone methyltransferase / 2-methoxy-6-polyprenyl-1,4-benzoquinol methylase
MPPAGRPPLRDALSTPDRKRAYVRRLFSVIAPRYDLITVLLSYGQDRRWKRRLASMAGARSGASALDLACGTGDIAFELASRGARVVGLDVTAGMIAIAQSKRRPSDRASFIVGDMMELPFARDRFDIVTTGYGIRNVPEIEIAISEIHRVLKPGGVLLSLDFNRPASGAMRAIYLTYLTIVGSTLGLALHGDPDTYRYIPESIRRYPGAEAVSRMMLDAGFERCEWHPLLGGLMAIHHAVKHGARSELS